MSALPTSFEIALPGPSLDNPILWQRHVEAIEGWLRQRHTSDEGYRVKITKGGEPPRTEWAIRLQRGWLSGACVNLRPLRETPHRAQLTVEWTSRLADALGITLSVAGLPLGLLVLVAGVVAFGRFLLTLLIVAVLAGIWVVIAESLATLVARLVDALMGNEFDVARRSSLATEIRALPLPTRREG